MATLDLHTHSVYDLTRDYTQNETKLGFARILSGHYSFLAVKTRGIK